MSMNRFDELLIVLHRRNVYGNSLIVKLLPKVVVRGHLDIYGGCCGLLNARGERVTVL